MMTFICEHGNICQNCNDCYDDARALSELQEFGTFIPQKTFCMKHPGVPLTEHFDCLLCQNLEGVSDG